MQSNFRCIAKIRYDSENFSMIAKFLYDCENFTITVKFSLSLQKFHYACEIANLLLLLPASSSLHYASSSLLFLYPRLDEIDENSYELVISQHNFEAELDMTVKVYETCKTTKNNLETKSVALKDLHMSIGLNNMISTQKALKTYLK